jgi:hypothetical protein
MVKFGQVETKVFSTHNQQIILDSDVAELDGVGTKEINQAVKNNPDKFPQGYIIEITQEEKKGLVKNFDRFN